MIRLRAVLVALATMFAAGAGVAAPAQASDAGVLACQPSSLYVHTVSGSIGSFRCSGTYFMSVDATMIVTNVWTGSFVADNLTVNFCDRQTFSFSPSAHITRLTLSATRAPWC